MSGHPDPMAWMYPGEQGEKEELYPLCALTQAPCPALLWDNVQVCVPPAASVSPFYKLFFWV